MTPITAVRIGRPLAALVCAVFLVLPGVAAAFNEIEPNNDWLTAQSISNLSGGFVIDGSRPFDDGSDDFFTFTVRGPGLLRIESSSQDSMADSIMGLYGTGGTLLASADGGGANAMAAIEYTIGAAGTYTLGFSGYNPALELCTPQVIQCYDTNDDSFFDTFVAGGGMDGSRGWNYSISLSGVALVPEPHAALMFAPGLAALLLMRRRRLGSG
jgi:hypothetical protein